MRPPFCRICDKKLVDMENGGLIYFKKRSSDKKWDKKMKKKKMNGHPPYADWFCNEHYQKANELKYLTIDKAMEALKGI
ncbi:MAG: hypothetical protein ACTSRI_04155 [Promethearchaeota archaeon]